MVAYVRYLCIVEMEETSVSVCGSLNFYLQIVDESTLKEACEEHPLCVVSVLPHILDCQADCRNSYLDILKKMGDRYKKKLWG
jgi:hypothetical protein